MPQRIYKNKVNSLFTSYVTPDCTGRRKKHTLHARLMDNAVSLQCAIFPYHLIFKTKKLRAFTLLAGILTLKSRFMGAELHNRRLNELRTGHTRRFPMS
jgi:hypothetical protein